MAENLYSMEENQRLSEVQASLRLLNVFLGITAGFSLLYLGVSALIGFSLGVVLEAVNLVLTPLIYLVVKLTKSYRLGANLYIADCFLVSIVGCSFFTGGIYSMVFPWFILIPLTGVFLLGFRVDSLVWTLITLLTALTYGALALLGYDFPKLYNLSWEPFFNTLCISGLVGIVFLISWAFDAHRSRSRRELARAVEELSAANKSMELLVYKVTHDLKAPLKSVAGFAGYIKKDLAEGRPADRALKDASRIQEIAARAESFVEDLLDASRGKISQVIPTRFSMKDLTDELIMDFKPELDQAQARVTWRGTWTEVTTDRRLIRQIWQNLLQNSLKYRIPDIPLNIELSMESLGDKWRLGLRDNGRGLSPQDLKRLFSSFRKLDPSTPGSGVGLSLVSQALALLGGRLWADSEGPGRGAAFYFEF